MKKPDAPLGQSQHTDTMPVRAQAGSVEDGRATVASDVEEQANVDLAWWMEQRLSVRQWDTVMRAIGLDPRKSEDVGGFVDALSPAGLDPSLPSSEYYAAAIRRLLDRVPAVIGPSGPHKS